MLTVITGPMFSGKTTRLLDKLNTHRWPTHKAVLIRPDTDTRPSETHDGRWFSAEVIGSDDAEAIERLMKENDFIAIDEAQFFSKEVYEIIRVTVQADGAKYIYAAGLDLDSDGQPYGIMPDLLALADGVVKLRATCDACASREGRATFCKVKKKQQDLIGGSDLFMALCWGCWAKKREEQSKE